MTDEMRATSRSVKSFTQSSLAKNIVSLYLVRGVNYVLPLLVLPYLFRMLGPRAYGAIVFAQSLMAYVALITDFGFSLSATRAVSLVREDHAQLAKLFWTILAAKVLLLVAMGAVIVLAVFIVPELRAHAKIIFICGLSVIGSVVLPQWYFQGLEKMSAMAWIQAVSKVLGLLPIVFFVHSSRNQFTAAMLLSAPSLIGGVVCLSIVKYVAPVSRYRPTLREIREAYADSRHLFVSNVATSAYVTGNALILGFVSGDAAVAIYSVANRVALAAFSFFSPVIQATFPRASLLFGRSLADAKSFVRRISVVLVAGSAVISALLFIFAREIVAVIAGPRYATAIPVLRVMSLLPIVVCVATILAQIVMVNIGLSRALSRIYIFMAVVSFTVMPILGGRFGALGGASALMIVEALGPLIMVGVIYLSRGAIYSRTSIVTRK